MTNDWQQKEISSLDGEELSFFKHYGYLIKKQVISAQSCQILCDQLWETAPKHLDRKNPGTWRPIPSEHGSPDPILSLNDTKWQYRGAGTTIEQLSVMKDPQIMHWAEQMLGQGQIREPIENGKPMGSWGTAWPGGPVDPQLGEGTRGIYATLPKKASSTQADLLHTDGHPFHLGVVCLLDDCPPDSGAFKVWPGSHRRFYPLFPMQYDQARIPFYEHMPSHKGIIHPKDYLLEVTQVQQDTNPVDCFGERGDIVFWHHRLGHMAGYNNSDSQTIRQALLFDYCHKDLDTLRLSAPHPNMWNDWSVQLQQAEQAISAETSELQQLNQSQP